MKIPSQQIADMGITYVQLGEAIILSLEGECETLEELLIDYELYLSTETYKINRFDVIRNYILLKIASEDFRQILKIAHELISEYRGPGDAHSRIDDHAPMLISEFLKETYNRYSQHKKEKLPVERSLAN